MTEEVSIDLEEIIEREKNSNKSKDGRKKLYILSTLVIVVISGIVVTLLTNFYSSQKGNTYISNIETFQTFRKDEGCAKFLFFELETLNFGYLVIFIFPLTVQSFSKIEQH